MRESELTSKLRPQIVFVLHVVYLIVFVQLLDYSVYPRMCYHPKIY